MSQDCQAGRIAGADEVGGGLLAGTPSRQSRDEPRERGCRNRMKVTAVSPGDFPSLGATADLALEDTEIGS